MIFYKSKKKNYNKYIKKLPKLKQIKNDIIIIYKTKYFYETIIKKIYEAKKYIYITALYIEQDDAGKKILNSLYKAKSINKKLDIKIIVDLHRANRGKIGEKTKLTNAEWYKKISKKNKNINIEIFGIPVNTREIFGVFHFKGFLFDNLFIYSGASISNSYLQQKKIYRYDRYHLFKNKELVKIIKNFIDKNLLSSNIIQRLDKKSNFQQKKIKKKIKIFRNKLKNSYFKFKNNVNNTKLSITPLIGLGKKNLLNQTIINLMNITKKKITICTPYFNFPKILIYTINKLLKNGKKIEIIVGDKTSSDFYKSPEKPFKIINILPYIYEINLYKIIKKLQYFIDNNQLYIRIWKNNQNSYHIKGIWVDKKWQLITGHNLNPRSWNLDLENAILIHDPEEVLKKQKKRTFPYQISF